MSFQLSFGSIKQYESREAAERAIEIFFPAGYCYEVVETRMRCCSKMYSVKAYDKSGAFAGYCYDVESE